MSCSNAVSLIINMLTPSSRKLKVEPGSQWSTIKQQFSSPLVAGKGYKFQVFWAVGPTFQADTCNFKVEVGGVSIASGGVGSVQGSYLYQEFAQTFTAQSAVDTVSIALECPSISGAVDYFFDDISIIDTTSGVTTICAETPSTPGGTGTTTPTTCGSNLVSLPATT